MYHCRTGGCVNDHGMSEWVNWRADFRLPFCLSLFRWWSCRRWTPVVAAVEADRAALRSPTPPPRHDFVAVRWSSVPCCSSLRATPRPAWVLCCSLSAPTSLGLPSCGRSDSGGCMRSSPLGVVCLVHAHLGGPVVMLSFRCVLGFSLILRFRILGYR